MAMSLDSLLELLLLRIYQFVKFQSPFLDRCCFHAVAVNGVNAYIEHYDTSNPSCQLPHRLLVGCLSLWSKSVHNFNSNFWHDEKLPNLFIDRYELQPSITSDKVSIYLSEFQFYVFRKELINIDEQYLCALVVLCGTFHENFKLFSKWRFQSLGFQWCWNRINYSDRESLTQHWEQANDMWLNWIN